LFITYAAGDGNDIALVASPDGDFDIDNDVDGLDFLKWQRGFGSTYDANDLADWEANFGTVAPLSAVAAATTVPEPTTGILLVLGMAAMFFRRNVIVSYSPSSPPLL